MRQIGARQEASRLGAIGSCGRELCCSTWLTDFRSVSTSAARYQQLSLNPQKLAGQCGKLKCCLNYELDMYLEELKSFPKSDVKIHTEKGSAFHIKTDVFKRQMWFAYSGEAAIGSGLIALSPDRVKEIIALNKEGVKPKDLSEFAEKVEVEAVTDYENVVGQDSLNRFEHAFKSKKKKKRKPGGGQGNPKTDATATAVKAPKPQGNQPKGQQQQPQKPQRNQQQRPQQKPANPAQANQPKNQQQQEGGEQQPKRNNNKNRRRNPNRNKENKENPKGENQ